MAQNDPRWPILPSNWLRLAQNGQFWSIFNFSHLFPQKAAQIDSEWSILPDLQLFQSFPTGVAQNHSEWPISLNSQLFFPTEVVQNDSEQPISPYSELFQSFPSEAAHFLPNFKIFISGGGVHQPVFSDLQLFKSFPTEVAQKTHNCQLCHRSGLDWLRMANFGQFSTFSIFSHKKRLRLTQNGQFHPIR